MEVLIDLNLLEELLGQAVVLALHYLLQNGDVQDVFYFLNWLYKIIDRGQIFFSALKALKVFEVFPKSLN